LKIPTGQDGYYIIGVNGYTNGASNAFLQHYWTGDVFDKNYWLGSSIIVGSAVSFNWSCVAYMAAGDRVALYTFGGYLINDNGGNFWLRKL
jgi:hypothetical protein